MAVIPIKNRQIAEEAASWAVRLDAGALSSGERQDLAAWLKASPLHVDELLISASMITGFGLVDAEKQICVEDLLAETDPEVLSLFQNTQNNNETAGKTWLQKWNNLGSSAIAASVAAVLLVGVMLFSGGGTVPGNLEFETQTGEQRSLTLADGSIVHVNTKSDIRIHFSSEERSIELLNGEALFEVAHDPERPFRVHAGKAVAEAIGTTFNVRRIDNKTTVAVVEGKVAVLADEEDFVGTVDVGTLEEESELGEELIVADRELSRLLLEAGEQASVEEAGHVAPVAEPNMEAVTSWRLRKLVFKSDSLATIAAEFNRYNRERIVVADPVLASLQLSGVFDADDPQSFVSFLEMSGAVQVRRTSSGAFQLTSNSLE